MITAIFVLIILRILLTLPSIYLLDFAILVIASVSVCSSGA